MSDFDKEAERERLREKYERDQRKRESTERMSELLLKGATMTNAHCETCGDPIFRYDGEEFCPTCQEVVAGESPESAETEADADSGTPPGARGGHPSGGDEAGAASASAPGTNGANADAGEQAATGESEAGEPDRADARGSDPSRDASGTGLDPAGSPGGETQNRATGGDGRTTLPDRGDASSRPAAPGDGDGLAAARDSVTRTLLAQARAAEECTDPRQARDHLAAAREAAETLSALSSY